MLTDVENLSASSLSRVGRGYVAPSTSVAGGVPAPRAAPGVVVSLGSARPLSLVYNADGRMDGSERTGVLPDALDMAAPSTLAPGLDGGAFDATATRPFLPGAPATTDVFAPAPPDSTTLTQPFLLADNDAFFLPGALPGTGTAITVPPGAAERGPDLGTGLIPPQDESRVIAGSPEVDAGQVAVVPREGNAAEGTERVAAALVGAGPVARGDAVLDVDAVRTDAVAQADAIERTNAARAGVDVPDPSRDEDLLVEIMNAREFAAAPALVPSVATTLALTADDRVPLTVPPAPPADPTRAAVSAEDDAAVAVTPVDRTAGLTTSPPATGSTAATQLTPMAVDPAGLAHDNISRDRKSVV